ncbi:pentapeptide repeat family protein [Staphylococcus phage vB_SauM-V1SA22]|nr:pentapeptide repeat family protein [Staphylococcus phage vB_SauM-V1SA22]
MKTITQEELDKVLKEHKLWLNSDGVEGTRANLSYTMLRSVNLRGADLRRAILRKADLSHAYLTGAILREVDLDGAILSHIDLSNADLTHASLKYVDLRYADLSYAILSSTYLSSADLRFSYLDNAILKFTNLSRASITGVIGLNIYSIDNIGTFNGKVTYIPSLDTVFAGCWDGNLEEFLEKGLEMNEGKEADKIKKAYEFFKVCTD